MKWFNFEINWIFQGLQINWVHLVAGTLLTLWDQLKALLAEFNKDGIGENSETVLRFPRKQNDTTLNPDSNLIIAKHLG